LSRAVRYGLPPNGRTTAAVFPPVGVTFLGLVLLTLATGCDRAGNRPANRTLVSLLSAKRPGEGRLVGAPCLKVSPPDLQQTPPPAKGSTRGSGLPEEDKQTTARISREGAVADLIAGRVDTAIAKLSEAVALSPAQAILWSDLAAAHLQRSAAASDP
jgi:hypothetical protein